MKVLKGWYLVLPSFAFFSLFFGWICIHTSLGLYFNVDPIASAGLNIGSTRLYWGISVITGLISAFIMPLLYWLHLRDDIKYEERVDIPLDKLSIRTYINVSVVVNNDYAWILKKSPLGIDLQKQGYLTFYNYYDRHKKFKNCSLRTRFIK